VAAPTETISLVVVSADPARAAGLDGFAVRRAPDAAAALALLRQRDADVVLADYRLAGGTGLDLFRDCEREHFGARRVLATAYADLPELAAERENGLLSRVVPEDGAPQTLAATLREVVAGAKETTASTARPTFQRGDVAPLLEWTAREAARVRNVVVRGLPDDAAEAQAQWVMPLRSSLEAFRQAAVARWHLPLKPRDAPLPPGLREHPVAAWLGGLSERAEVFCRKVDGEEVYAYLALLPWTKEARVTCVLGVASEPASPEWRAAVEAAHGAALQSVATFPLPAVPHDEEASGLGQLVPEYDWVVTRGYAGKDRRRGETAFLGKHAFVGKRARVPSRIKGRLGVFADRLSPLAQRALVAWVGLTVCDAVLTWRFAGARVTELNPLMAALLAQGPWAFFLVKQAAALAAFLLVTRFEHARAGRWVAVALLALFAAVDAWWLVLLARG
jgi:DNA-binding NarL/FixJ family response regulator